MNGTLFGSRPWLAKLSLGAAPGATALFGLRAETAARENPAATLKTVNRSEAAAGRGYSGVVKRVIPAVVNISSSRVVKSEMGGGGMGRRGRGQGDQDQGLGMDPFFRQFFGDNFSQRFAVPKD